MLKRKLIFLFSFVFVLCTNAQNQDAIWTLEECINYAFENNLQLKLSELNYKNSEINLLQARQNKYPSFNGNASYFVNFAGATDPTTFEFTNQSISTNSYSINGNVILYQGGFLNENISNNELQLYAAGLDIEQAKNDLALAIAQAYLQILLNEEQLKSAYAQYELTIEQVKNTRKQIEAGILAEGDILVLEAQMVRDEATITSVRNAIDLSVLSLKQFLEIDLNTPFQVEVPEFEAIETEILKVYNAAKIYEQALFNQPLIKKAFVNNEIAKSNLLISKTRKLPTVSLGGNLNTSFSSARQEVTDFEIDGFTEIGFVESSFSPVLSPNVIPVLNNVGFGNQLKDNFLQSVGLNVTVPIFNKFQINNGISQAKIGIEMAQINEQIERRNLERNITQAYADAVSAAKNYEASKKSAEATKRALDFVSKKMELGAGNSLELIQAQNNFTAAQLENTANKYRFIFAIKVLDFYKGEQFNLN